MYSGGGVYIPDNLSGKAQESALPFPSTLHGDSHLLRDGVAQAAVIGDSQLDIVLIRRGIGVDGMLLGRGLPVSKDPAPLRNGVLAIGVGAGIGKRAGHTGTAYRAYHRIWSLVLGLHGIDSYGDSRLILE